MRVFHIPACPFSQRLEILLELKGQRDAVEFVIVDITKPRPQWLLDMTRGTTALPVLQLDDSRILKESLVLLEYLDVTVAGPHVRQADPYRRAVESMMTRFESDFGAAGYRWVMSQDEAKRDELRARMLEQYARLDDFLVHHSPDATFLFDTYGWAECVFTPFFMRFWFLEYYEDFALPPDARYDRVRRWIDACIAHPAAQQVDREQIVKLYYDYAQGAGNGVLPTGRQASSFSFEPSWRERPWPPHDKYSRGATDAQLGLASWVPSQN